MSRLRILRVAGVALFILAIAACSKALPEPSASEVIGNWRLRFPEYWLEKRGPRTLDLVLKKDGTFYETERWRSEVETVSGRWVVNLSRIGPEVVLSGSNDNGTEVSSTLPLYRRGKEWVLGIDGGPNLGQLFFARATL
jgi:hypothetical protein